MRKTSTQKYVIVYSARWWTEQELTRNSTAEKVVCLHTWLQRALTVMRGRVLVTRGKVPAWRKNRIIFFIYNNSFLPQAYRKKTVSWLVFVQMLCKSTRHVCMFLTQCRPICWPLCSHLTPFSKMRTFRLLVARQIKWIANGQFTHLSRLKRNTCMRRRTNSDENASGGGLRAVQPGNGSRWTRMHRLGIFCGTFGKCRPFKLRLFCVKIASFCENS